MKVLFFFILLFSRHHVVVLLITDTRTCATLRRTSNLYYEVDCTFGTQTEKTKDRFAKSVVSHNNNRITVTTRHDSSIIILLLPKILSFSLFDNMILQEIGHCRDDNGNSKRPPCKNNLNRVSSVCVMAVVAVTTVASLNSMSLLRSSSDTNQDLKKTSNQQKFYETTTFHQSGFGGIFNPTHEEGEKARRFLSKREVTIPKSAVKHAIPSLGRQNIENLAGHYYHDEHHSPFSSYLYDRPKEELIEEQKEYELKMVKVREEWGAWSFEDEQNIVRPVANFDKIPYKDMNNNMFPENSWQTDEKYVRDFISQANSLVDRMIEGIYAEYGHPTKKSDGTKLTVQEIEERNALFKVHISDSPLHQGMSYINEKGMDALSRKLLHGMITNDEFYFVLGGHSAAAGHGNNFLQQKTMQFHYIMEPVFQKLGMRLISRNLAMGGLGKCKNYFLRFFQY